MDLGTYLENFKKPIGGLKILNVCQ